MFESPVVLVEKDSIGALGFTLPAQIPNVDYGGMRGDPYGDEYNDEKVDDTPKRYIMVRNKRYQVIKDLPAVEQIEKSYQDFLKLPILSAESYFEV